MQLAMIGLGRMGADLSRRAHQRGGHEMVVHDREPEKVQVLVDEGVVRGAATLEELVDLLEAPRTVWIMVPAGAVGSVLDELEPLLDDGDTVIDGGNSNHRDDLERAARLAERGIHHVDVGVSGGVWGLAEGYCLMVGGEDEVVQRLEPLFRSLAPGVEAAPRTRGREGEPTPAEHGWLHCGSNGAGHLVKTVHNGVEYGAMAALAEGLNVLANAGAGRQAGTVDAETAPLRRPDHYCFDVDLAAVAEVWRRGSVIRSWLLDLTAAALHDDAGLDSYAGRVSDSGEGRWTVDAAIDVGVPVPVLASALFSRFSSRENDGVANRLVSAMRRAFGGHEERPSGD